MSNPATIDQTRPDQTRPDQTRPDQTRPDRNSWLKTVKEFVKKHDRFHLIIGLYRWFYHTIYHRRWWKDKHKVNSHSKISFSRIPYVIRRQDQKAGLFSYFNTFLGGIAYAEQNGYIPVVDMKNYLNSYLYDSELGHVNAWEYYFEQPEGLSLEEALAAKEYILSRDTHLHPYPATTDDAESLEYWRKLCRKYIRFKPAVLERLEVEAQKLAGKKVLGVSLRGTDYVKLRLHGHPVQPTPEQAINKTREVMASGKYDAIYLSVEDAEYINAFQQAFGESLILPDREAIDFDPSEEKWITEVIGSKRENDKYLTGLEYLVSMLMLTKCNALITSVTSGSAGVMCLSDGFDYLYIFDLGRYK